MGIGLVASWLLGVLQPLLGAHGRLGGGGWRSGGGPVGGARSNAVHNGVLACCVYIGMTWHETSVGSYILSIYIIKLVLNVGMIRVE